jgi:pimeloyl-ACP methyl ester carboxylesterase
MPAWANIPSWFVYGSQDRAIPPALHAFMAERAAARRVKVIDGASHLVMVSHPVQVAKVILDAITSRSR